MKKTVFQNNKVKPKNNKNTRFNNNEITSRKTAKIKGGEDDIIITEDCMDI